MNSTVLRRARRADDVPRPAVLLVDDRPANLLALEAILEPLDVDMVRAGSGEEALKQLLKKEFALILLDVQMPGMDGFETASAIKAHSRTADLPIIFITAISREASNVFAGYSRGAVDYLLKPFDPQILRAKVSVFVDLYVKNETIKAQAELLHAREMQALERIGTNRLRALTESMPIIMWALGRTGDVYYVNRAWLEYSGLTAQETGGIDNPLLVHPEDASLLQSRWAAAMAQRCPLDIEIRLRRKSDGSYRWHLVRTVPERRDTGGLEGWIMMATDVHEQKMLQHAQEELLEKEHQARQAAEATSRLKDEFLANVSHELRTPLNAILGWTRMLRSGMLEASRSGHALEAIERSARSQADLVEDLLDVSRIISGKLRIKTLRLELGKVVHAAVETMRPAADLKGIDIECTVVGIEEISGDPDRIQQIVWNLVSNAVKFTNKSGHVRVRVEPKESMVGIVVTDTGAGISADFLPHAFDRFRQADNSSTRAHQGLGLGLAIVRHLVELHGGQVRAESAGLGQGATFTVLLPHRLVASSDPEPRWFHEAESQQPSVLAEPQRLEGLTILFVDDHEDARELFTEFLCRVGATVVAVGSAAAALDALKVTRPHVMISDIGLPGEDGIALIRQVRTIAPSLPAIAVSGYARSEDRSRALAEGFQMHLTKPVNLDEVVALIASLAEARKGPQPVANAD